MISLALLTMIYFPLLYVKLYFKDVYYVTKHIRRKVLCSSGKLFLLFHYIHMLTYCVGYKQCFMFDAELNILYDIVSYLR